MDNQKRRATIIIVCCCIVALFLVAFIIHQSGIVTVYYTDDGPQYIGVDGRVYQTEDVYILYWEYDGERHEQEVIAYTNPPETDKDFETIAKSHFENYYEGIDILVEDIHYWFEKVPTTLKG